MEFCHAEKQPGAIWVDRGTDDKVDHFEPCTSCFGELEPASLDIVVWNELHLGSGCGSRLELESAINAKRDEGPFNVDAKPITIHAEDLLLPHFSCAKLTDAYYGPPGQPY